MKIKTVHLVSEDELKTLSKSIEFCIERINENDLDRAIWTLERMKENINKTLEDKGL